MQFNWTKITHKLPEGNFVLPIPIQGNTYTLVSDNGKFYVFQSKCPHAHGLLYNGWCKEGKLICPIHRYSYSLETGRGSSGQGDYLTTYPVESRTDGLYVGIKKKWWKSLFS